MEGSKSTTDYAAASASRILDVILKKMCGQDCFCLKHSSLSFKAGYFHHDLLSSKKFCPLILGNAGCHYVVTFVLENRAYTARSRPRGYYGRGVPGRSRNFGKIGVCLSGHFCKRKSRICLGYGQFWGLTFANAPTIIAQPASRVNRQFAQKFSTPRQKKKPLCILHKGLRGVFCCGG